jgi:hypothetical protein
VLRAVHVNLCYINGTHVLLLVPLQLESAIVKLN